MIARTPWTNNASVVRGETRARARHARQGCISSHGGTLSGQVGHTRPPSRPRLLDTSALEVCQFCVGP